MATFDAALLAYFEESKRRAIFYAFLSGFLLGWSIGIRLDAVLLGPAVALLFLFSNHAAGETLFLCCVGSLPGLTTLALVNHLKFGVWFPFYIGASPIETSDVATQFTPARTDFPAAFAVACAVAIFLLWVITRPPFWRLAKERWKLFAAVGLLFVSILLITPQSREVITAEARNAYMMLVDIRVRDRAIEEPALFRSQGGGMVYSWSAEEGTDTKHALLTVAPHSWYTDLSDRNLTPTVTMFVVPVTCLIFFSYWNDHGGLCLNLRYFLPVLPFTSILTAYAIRCYKRRCNRKLSVRVLLLASLLAGLSFYPLVAQCSTSPDSGEIPVLDCTDGCGGYYCCHNSCGRSRPRRGVVHVTPHRRSGFSLRYDLGCYDGFLL